MTFHDCYKVNNNLRYFVKMGCDDTTTSLENKTWPGNTNNAIDYPQLEILQPTLNLGPGQNKKVG